MKYAKQIAIILFISFLGELIHYVAPIPVPASIYGMVLMFIGLMTGIIKLSDIKETSNLLIVLMPLMFIPAGVGLMTKWSVLQPVIVPVSIITVVTIIVVMAVTGTLSQFVIRFNRRRRGEDTADQA